MNRADVLSFALAAVLSTAIVLYFVSVAHGRKYGESWKPFKN